MNGRDILNRWTTVHALKYIEKNTGDDITDETITVYLDESGSYLLPYLMSKWGDYYVTESLINAINDLK